jgi:hypothetical protein
MGDIVRVSEGRSEGIGEIVRVSEGRSEGMGEIDILL